MRIGAVTGEQGVLVAARVMRPETAWERMRGLLGRPRLMPGEGMLLDPCAAVHTMGMGYPIDLVFLSRDGVAVKLSPRTPPFRFRAARGAGMTLELWEGAISERRLTHGARLRWAEPSVC